VMQRFGSGRGVYYELGIEYQGDENEW
jgi:hypothetical protein